MVEQQDAEELEIHRELNYQQKFNKDGSSKRNDTRTTYLTSSKYIRKIELDYKLKHKHIDSRSGESARAYENVAAGNK
ncbi:MAG: hypothetical protein M3044_05630 [Thermoproteota archaeon]|nr:hypothetical protein [Thermoproteota archaeon]